MKVKQTKNDFLEILEKLLTSLVCAERGIKEHYLENLFLLKRRNDVDR